MKIKAFFDGSCWPNPHGKARFGYVVYRDHIRIHDAHANIGQGYGMTNNVAEATALCELLDYLISEEFPVGTEVLICGDSKVVINVAAGRRKSPKGFFVPKAMEARAKMLTLQTRARVNLQWVPREENAEADELSQIQEVSG